MTPAKRSRTFCSLLILALLSTFAIGATPPNASAAPQPIYFDINNLPPAVTLTVGQELRLFQSVQNHKMAPFPSSSVTTTDNGTGEVLAWSTGTTKLPNGFVDAGGYKALRQGTAEVHVLVPPKFIVIVTVK